MQRVTKTPAINGNPRISRYQRVVTVDTSANPSLGAPVDAARLARSIHRPQLRSAWARDCAKRDLEQLLGVKHGV